MLLRMDYLSIGKRDADCYDIYHKSSIVPAAPGEKKVADGRVAALRAEFTTDEKGARTVIPGTWRIRWEHKYEGTENGRSYLPFAQDIPEAIEKLTFQTVHDAFAFYCSQVLV